MKSTEHFRVAGGIAFALLNAICGRFVLSMSYMHDGIKRYHCAYFCADFEWQREDLESGRTVCGRGVLKDNQSDVPVHLAMASDRSNADAARAFFDEPYGLAMRIEAVYELVARGTKRQKCGAICQVQHGGLPGPSPGVLADVQNVLHHRDTQAPSQRRISKAGSAAHGAPRNVLLRQLEQCRDRASIERIETQLRPLQNSKEWGILLTSRAKGGNLRGAHAVLDEMRRMAPKGTMVRGAASPRSAPQGSHKA